MIRAIHHVAISTPNIERLRAFYCNLLGFRERSRVAWEAGQAKIDAVLGLPGTAATAVMLELGPTCVELFQFEAPQPGPLRATDRPVNEYGITHLCFDVDDVDAEYRRLAEAGVRFHCPPQDFGAVKATYGRDPDGNVFELQEIVAD